jgi:hypothetical protein
MQFIFFNLLFISRICIKSIDTLYSFVPIGETVKEFPSKGILFGIVTESTSVPVSSISSAVSQLNNKTNNGLSPRHNQECGI